MGYKRYRSEENPQTLRWFQNEKGNIISVVTAPFNGVGGQEVRASDKFGFFRIPGNIVPRRSDEEIIKVVKRTMEMRAREHRGRNYAK